MPTAIAAAQAYASLARMTDAAGLAKAGSESPGGAGFGALLKEALARPVRPAKSRTCRRKPWLPANPT